MLVSANVADLGHAQIIGFLLCCLRAASLRADGVSSASLSTDGHARDESTTLRGVWIASRHAGKSTNYDFSQLTDVVLNQDFGTSGSPGAATPHGLRYASLNGAFFAKQYSNALFGGAATSCKAVADIVEVVADAEARDMETGKHWLKGFAPSCTKSKALSVISNAELLNEGKEDLLYPGCEYASAKEVIGLYDGDVDSWIKTNLAPNMQALSRLVPLKASACPDLKVGETCTFMNVPNKWEGGFWRTWTGGWADAAHVAAVLQTQFVNGGSALSNANLTSEDITFLYDIAATYWMSYKTRINKNRFGGNLPTHILQQMDQTIKGEITKKFHWFMGHDVNVAFLADFLGVSLAAPSWTPAAGSTIFVGALGLELHESKKGGFSVRAFHQASTMQQMRDLDVSSVPRNLLSISWCSRPLDCPVAEFFQGMRSQINTQCINPALKDWLTSTLPAHI